MSLQRSRLESCSSSISSKSNHSFGLPMAAAVRPLDRSLEAPPPCLKSSDTYTSVSSLAGDHTQYIVTHCNGSKTIMVKTNYGGQNGDFRTIKTTPAPETSEKKCNLFGIEYNGKQNESQPENVSLKGSKGSKFHIRRN